MRLPTLPSPRERAAILTALREERPPPIGHRFVLVDRETELGVLTRDVDRLTRGGGTFHALLGAPGVGTTFLLGAVGAHARDRRVVTSSVNVGSDLHLSGGRGRVAQAYRAVVARLATRAVPDGGALPRILDRFVAVADSEARAAGIERDTMLRRRLHGLLDLPGGAAFGAVALAAARTLAEGLPDDRNPPLRALLGHPEPGPFAGIFGLSERTGWDHVRLLARLCRLAGYAGLLVIVDGLRLPARARARADLLARLDPLRVGPATPGFGVLVGGSEAVPRRPGTPPPDGDPAPFGGAVLRLAPLHPEARLVLLRRVAALHGAPVDPEVLLRLDAEHRDLAPLLRALVTALDGAAYRVAVNTQDRDVHP